jgi:predicted nucleic-acid-binding protein
VISLDTNVLVRYLTQDDAKQFQDASALLLGLEKQHQTALLSTIVLCETVWVLTRAYKIERIHIADMLDKLLSTSLFVIDNKDTVREAIDLYRTGKGDFADYMIGIYSRNLGSVTVATFDETLLVHTNLFSAPASALRKNKSTTHGHAVRGPGDVTRPRK